jgi:hypothetical protein
VHFTANTRFVIKSYCILLLSKQDKYYSAIKHHCYFMKSLPLSLRANVEEPEHFTPCMRNGCRMSHFQFCHQNITSAVRLNSQPLWKSCKQTTHSYYIHNCREIYLGKLREIYFFFTVAPCILMLPSLLLVQIIHN